MKFGQSNKLRTVEKGNLLSLQQFLKKSNVYRIIGQTIQNVKVVTVPYHFGGEFNHFILYYYKIIFQNEKFQGKRIISVVNIYQI